MAELELTHDPVNHPTHYTSHPSGIECIRITEHMGFCLGNAVKYVWRADLKNDAIEDLEKAKWYIDRELAKRRTAPAREQTSDTVSDITPETPANTEIAPDRVNPPLAVGQRWRTRGGSVAAILRELFNGGYPRWEGVVPDMNATYRWNDDGRYWRSSESDVDLITYIDG